MAFDRVVVRSTRLCATRGLVGSRIYGNRHCGIDARALGGLATSRKQIGDAMEDLMFWLILLSVFLDLILIGVESKKGDLRRSD